MESPYQKRLRTLIPACEIRKFSVQSFTFGLHSITNDKLCASVPWCKCCFNPVSLWGSLNKTRPSFCCSVSHAQSNRQPAERQGIHTDQPQPWEMSFPWVCDLHAPPWGSSELNALNWPLSFLSEGFFSLLDYRGSLKRTLVSPSYILPLRVTSETISLTSPLVCRQNGLKSFLSNHRF